MRGRLAFSLLLALSLLPHVSSAEEPPAYPEHARLMYYLKDGQEHAVKTAADWALRRKHILAGMEQAMGPLPDRDQLPPLDPQAGEAVDCDGYTRQPLSIVTEGADRVTAFLLLPDPIPAGERRAAMLCLHQTTPVGKAEVCGLGGSPNLHYARELAQRGYVVLAPDYPSFGELADYDFAADAYVSGSMKGIFNHMRSVDYLQSRADVDPERIGVIGHSLGGHNSMFVGVFDERLKAVVSCCGWCPFHDYYGGKIKGWTSDRYMPRLADVYGLDPDRVPFDFYEVVAALAPRGFFSVSPLKDSNFDVAGVKKAIPAAAEVYQLLGAADMLQVRYPDCEHDFPPAMRREAYQFLDHVLKHMPSADLP
jgi:pimeloyl-ACP methyl ester carboxylesterase